LRRKETDFEPQTIGEHIKKKRLALGLTQKAVAKLIRVTEFSVIHWENAEHQPRNAPTLQRIIRFLGYDPLPAKTTIPDLLRANRRQQGWGQRELAKHLGVDPATVANWESGGTILKYRHRQLVATLLGLPERETQESMRRRWNMSHARATPNHDHDVIKGIRAPKYATRSQRG